jgi:hypothetical protein
LSFTAYTKLIDSTEVLLFFNIILEHIVVFVVSWHEFKNSIVVEIWLLHSQLFMSSYFHFFIIVELMTYHMLPQKPKQMGVLAGQVQDYSI